MSLDLDKRHRAMLREMGVRVWLPASTLTPSTPSTPPVNTEPVMVDASSGSTSAFLDQLHAVTVLPKEPATASTSPASSTSPLPATAANLIPPAARSPANLPAQSPSAGVARSGVAVSWRMGEATALYADAAHAGGARWLVLAETSTATLQVGPVFNPLMGEAGKLLDNMLRAARLHQAGVVLLAPLTRHAATDTEQGLPAMLETLIMSAQPDVVLVMGRLASQALLRSDEAFGKLRGQVHTLFNAKTVVTYDATYLLRNQGDKAKAWDDLCLAISLVAAPRA